jgi:hypothetical protein
VSGRRTAAENRREVAVAHATQDLKDNPDHGGLIEIASRGVPWDRGQKLHDLGDGPSDPEQREGLPAGG